MLLLESFKVELLVMQSLVDVTLEFLLLTISDLLTGTIISESSLLTTLFFKKFSLKK